MALRERVHGILLQANDSGEDMTSSAASECLYGAGLGLRYVQASRAARRLGKQSVCATQLHWAQAAMGGGGG